MTVQRRSAFLLIPVATSSTRVIRRDTRRHSTARDVPTEGRIRTGRWAGFPVGVQKYGSTPEASTWQKVSQSEPYHVLSGSMRRPCGVWEREWAVSPACDLPPEVLPGRRGGLAPAAWGGRIVSTPC